MLDDDNVFFFFFFLFHADVCTAWSLRYLGPKDDDMCGLWLLGGRPNKGNTNACE